MIDGFKLKISSKELEEHCRGRAVYHGKRAAEYQSELPKIKDAMDALHKQGIVTEVTQMHGKGGMSSYDLDPVEDMEKKIQDHANKGLVFTFFAEHLFPEDYNLNENDLIRLEILKR